MPLTHWDARYSIGIDELDDHHRHLISLLNQAYESFVSETSDWDPVRVIEALMDYTRYHFSAEEALMQDTHYPEFASHKALHNHFVERLNRLQEHVLACNRHVAFELLTFLNSWLHSHIHNVDAQFGSFFTSANNQHAA